MEWEDKQILTADAKLPHLDIAWSERKATEFFNNVVLPSVESSQVVVSLTRKDLAYTPGRRCTALYSLKLADRSVWASASFAKDDRLEEVYGRYYLGPKVLDGLPAAVILPKYRCLVEFFPMDWRLPALPSATDPENVVPRLASFLSNGREPASVNISTLAYRPHETCVLCYSVTWPDKVGSKDLVGKVYRDAPRAKRAWDSITSLAGKDAGITVPKPIGYISEWNLVLMERAVGVSMRRLLPEATTKARGRELARLAAVSLAAFHRLAMESQEVRTFDTDLAKLEKRLARLESFAPDLERAARAILDRLKPLLAAHPAYTFSLIHGDCTPNQFLVNGDRVAIVDFDAACLGDPAIDLGNFMARFHKYDLTSHNSYLRALADYFLDVYVSQSGRAELANRARLFRVLSLVRMAARRVEGFSDSVEGTVPSLQELLLQEADKCLSKLSR